MGICGTVRLTCIVKRDIIFLTNGGIGATLIEIPAEVICPCAEGIEWAWG